LKKREEIALLVILREERIVGRKAYLMFATLLAMMLFQVGCVEVRTWVKANGYVVKEIVIRTNRYYEESLEKRAKNSLEDWNVWHVRRGDTVEIHIKRKFDPRRTSSPLPGMRVSYERELKWFPPTGRFRYTETFDFSKFAKALSLAEPELGALDKVNVNILITMPSKVMPQLSNSNDVQGNTARWTIERFGESVGKQALEFDVAASGIRKTVVLLYVLIVLCILIGGYIFYPKVSELMSTITDRLSTIRTVGWLRRRKR
jgi:hypothetical protein